MARLPQHHLAVVFAFVVIFFPTAVRADIMNYNVFVRNERLTYIDSFKFTDTKGAAIQLKATRVSFSNYPTNANLSRIGFILSHKKYPFNDGGCRLDEKNDYATVYTFDMINGADNFNLTFTNVDSRRKRSLFLENCLPFQSAKTYVSMNLRSEMYNLDPETGRHLYLSADKTFLIKVYPFFSIAHFSLVCLWIYILCISCTFCRVHVVMLVVPFFKAWSLFLQVLHDFYILQFGCTQCWRYQLLTIASDTLNWVPLISVFFLIIGGWSFLNRKFLLKDKILFMCLIIQELCLVSLKIYFIQDLSPGTMFSYFYPGIFHQVGSLFRFFALYRIMQSSFKFMRESKNVNHTELFDLLYEGYFFYYVFQVGVDIPLDIVSSHFLLSGLLKESATLVFYLFVGYKCRALLQQSSTSIIGDVRKKDEPFLYCDP